MKLELLIILRTQNGSLDFDNIQDINTITTYL